MAHRWVPMFILRIIYSGSGTVPHCVCLRCAGQEPADAVDRAAIATVPLVLLLTVLQTPVEE